MEDDLDDVEEPSPAEVRKREGTTAELRERLRQLEEKFDILHGHIDEEQADKLIAYLEWLTCDPTLDNQSADSRALFDDLSAADDLKIKWRRLEAARGECLENVELMEEIDFFTDIAAMLDVYEKNLRDMGDALYGPKLEYVVSKINRAEETGRYVEWKHERPSWRIGALDKMFPKNHLATADGLHALLTTLKSYETMTWGEIEQAPHCHAWESTDDWDARAVARLVKLNLGKALQWWQLRGGNMQRIFGYREGPIMNVVWHDLTHEVYRTKGRKK